MMIYTLIMTICLLNEPASCSVQEELTGPISVNPGMAHAEAQAMTAAWLKDHPDLILKRWSLKPGRPA